MTNTIEMTIKKAGWGRKKAMKKQIDAIANSLLEGEELLGVAASYPNPTNQLYITNKRIIVHKIEGITKNNKVEIPLSSISSISNNTSMLEAQIEIITSNNTATIEKIPIDTATEIKKILDNLILNK